MNQKNRTFEENMQRLEQIVRSMEKGDVPLEESLRLFGEGTALIQTCEKMLNDAELQITKIVPGMDGRPTEEVFADAD